MPHSQTPAIRIASSTPHDKWECYKAGFYATTKRRNDDKRECRNSVSEIFWLVPCQIFGCA